MEVKSTVSNIFLIENLDKIKCVFKVYKIKGLPKGTEDYHKNVQILESDLSRISKSSCAKFHENGELFIAQPSGKSDLPKNLNLIGTTVVIEKTREEEIYLNNINTERRNIIVRFLQGCIEQRFYNDFNLWQPKPGHAYYSKFPDRDMQKKSNNVDVYRGFKFRIIIINNEKIGVCIDVSNKYVSRYTLPTNLSSDEFSKRYDGANCIYEYGNRWYEIRLSGFNDLNVIQVPLPSGNSLYDEIHIQAGSSKSKNLLRLPKNGSVAIYYTSYGQSRNVPTGLCRETFRTSHPSVKKLHDQAILYPNKRKRRIDFILNQYFNDLYLGESKILLSKENLSIKAEVFEIPDLEFGNNTILTTKKNDDGIKSSLEDFPKMKSRLLNSQESGFFKKKIFDRQYIILPFSVYQTFGKKFIEDLRNETMKYCDTSIQMTYNPTVITYDDSVQKTVAKIGRQIIKAMEDNFQGPGLGLVMVPGIKSKLAYTEDELSNLVMQELRSRKVYVSIIHNDVSERSYTEIIDDKGRQKWVLIDDEKTKKRFNGYLRNIVINKIMLLNSFWPFILRDQLIADLTIGLDVKNSTACFSIIYKTGENMNFYFSESSQKEQLSRNHIKTKIIEILKQEKQLNDFKIRNIVFHRQGRVFQSEIDGFNDAIEFLKAESTLQKILQKECNVTIVEVFSTSRIPLRIFELVSNPIEQKEYVYNPIVGTYFASSENSGFVCNTGPPYKFKGTTVPIQINRISGNLSIKSVMQDIFYLSNLTWTRIDYCSRLPITIKMADVRLRESAGLYDEDSLKFEDEYNE